MRTIIAGSGKGSNCNALLKAQSKKLIGKTQIVAVVSDKKESGILKVADKHKTPAIWLGEYKSNHHEAYDKLSPQEITWISHPRIRTGFDCFGWFYEDIKRTFYRFISR